MSFYDECVTNARFGIVMSQMTEDQQFMDSYESFDRYHTEEE